MVKRTPEKADKIGLIKPNLIKDKTKKPSDEESDKTGVKLVIKPTSEKVLKASTPSHSIKSRQVKLKFNSKLTQGQDIRAMFARQRERDSPIISKISKSIDPVADNAVSSRTCPASSSQSTRGSQGYNLAHSTNAQNGANVQ